MKATVQALIKVGIVVFPGTNCDRDTFMACEEFGWKADYIWHFETNLNGYDIIFLPGGFSYGDYIRSGRLAKFSPVMQAVKEFIENKQGFVVGICNGFQILCESGLLPGVLTDNLDTRFICRTQELILFNRKQIMKEAKRQRGKEAKQNEHYASMHLCLQASESSNYAIQLPIANKEGRYFAGPETIEQLKKDDMIFLTYKNNPNGSIEDIAGLYDKKRRIIGMMPHPERAFFSETGNVDGKEIFKIVEEGLTNVD